MADVKAKGPVVILILFLIISLAIAGLGFLALQKEKQVNSNLSRKIEELESLKRLSEDKAAQLTLQVSALQKTVDDANLRLTAAADELQTANKVKDDALLEASQVKEKLAAAENAKTDVLNKLKSAESDLKNVRDELMSLKAAKEDIQKKLKDMEEKGSSVQLDKIVVPSAAENNTGTTASPAAASGNQPQTTAAQAKQPPAVLEGKVLVVNKDYDFIVVNLGRKDNVSVGDVLSVARKNKKLGEFKIEEVRDTMSVATPLTKGLTAQIREDDKAVIK